VIPRERLVLSSLKDIESFIVISGIISPVVRVIVSEIDRNSSLISFLSLVDSKIEKTVFKGVSIME
jgi:hypothetical protein